MSDSQLAAETFKYPQSIAGHESLHIKFLAPNGTNWKVFLFSAYFMVMFLTVLAHLKLLFLIHSLKPALLEMWQILVEISAGGTTKLIGLKPNSTLHQHLIQSVHIAPLAGSEVAYLCASVVGFISVIFSACAVHKGAVIPLCFQRGAVRRAANHQFRTFVRKLLWDVDTKSELLFIIRPHLPFDSSFSSYDWIEPSHVIKLAVQYVFLHAKSTLLGQTPIRHCEVISFKCSL